MECSCTIKVKVKKGQLGLSIFSSGSGRNQLCHILLLPSKSEIFFLIRNSRLNFFSDKSRKLTSKINTWFRFLVLPCSSACVRRVVLLFSMTYEYCLQTEFMVICSSYSFQPQLYPFWTLQVFHKVEYTACQISIYSL